MFLHCSLCGYWNTQEYHPIYQEIHIGMNDASDMKYVYDVIWITGAWGMDFVSSFPLFSTTPPLFQNFHNHPFFKNFIIIPFSSFDNISRRHTSWIIRVFCVHSTVSVEKLWTQNTRIIHDVWRLLILSNEEKLMIMKILKKEWLWKFWKKGGSREKEGGGNEIHTQCACAQLVLQCT